MFPLSEKEKLLLEHHLPDTFFSFITGFFHKLHHYLLDEFQHKPFLDEYLREREVFTQSLRDYLYESDLVFSWIDFERYMNGEPAVPAVEAYTEIGHRAAEFQSKIQELLRKHFPDKYDAGPPDAGKRMRYIVKRVVKRKQIAAAKEQVKAERPVKPQPEKASPVIDSPPSLTDVQTPANIAWPPGAKRAKQVSGHPPAKIFPAKSAEERSLPAKQTTASVQGQLPNEAAKEILQRSRIQPADAPDPKLRQAMERYQHEYRRFLYLEKGHPLLMNKIAEKKRSVLASIQKLPNHTELALFIEKGITLQPLPSLKVRTLSTVEEYEREAAKYFRYTSQYAVLAVQLYTKTFRMMEETKNEQAVVFFKDVLQLLRDLLKRTSFYLVPTTQHKDPSYTEIHGQRSDKRRFDFGVILEEEWNGKKIQKIIKKGAIQFY